MPANGPFNDPDLQSFPIQDFTSGIHRYSRPNIAGTYSPAPAGSAAHCYRCIAQPEIGLVPLPSYQLAQTYTVPADPANPICVSLGNMKSLTPRGGPLADIVSAFLVQHGQVGSGPGGIGGSTSFVITRLGADLVHFTPTTVYSSSATQPPLTTNWPMMDFGVWKDPTTGAFARTVLTTDPCSQTSSTGTWVTVRGWHTPSGTPAADSETGTFPIVSSASTYPRIFYHNGRSNIWQIEASSTTDGFVASDADVLLVSDPPLNPTIVTTAATVQTFFPEMGTQVGAWGTFQTGELVGIYVEGGAFMIVGDVLSATNLSIYKMSGVNGARGFGKAAYSPIGMIYPGSGGGVYLWNGDNTSQNISRQLPETVFNRASIGNNFFSSAALNAAQEVWSEWVMFPHNWLFDTSTQSWWLCEDPNVINFQVFAEVLGNALLSSPGIAYGAVNQPVSLNTYYWARGSAFSNYFWQSNPIPVSVGALVTLQGVEIVASNLSSTACTITVQPVSPQGTSSSNQSSLPYPSTPYQNQNANTAPITIPPLASGFRGFLRLGYTDYNISLAVTAANSNTSNPAPTLHGINCFYTQTRTSGVA